MKPNFNNCSDIKGLILLKKSVLTTVIFYTHKKTQEGRAFIGPEAIFSNYMVQLGL